MSYLGDCARVYVPTGKLAHLLAPGEPPSGDGESLCRKSPWASGSWSGTGSQGEYERAAELPLCSRCEYLAGAGTWIDVAALPMPRHPDKWVFGSWHGLPFPGSRATWQDDSD